MVHLHSIAINFQMFSNKCHYILLNYILALLSQFFSMIYFFVVCFTYAISKWRTIFKYYFFLLLLLGAAAVPVFGTVIVSLTSV